MIDSVISTILSSNGVKTAAIASGVAGKFAKLYVAGTTAATVREKAEAMMSRGLDVGFSYLPLRGSEQHSLAAFAELLETLGPISRGADISVRPSQIGISESWKVARQNVAKLCALAAASGATVTLETQGYKHYFDTVEVWTSLRGEFSDLGITLPVDIRRAERDCVQIAEEMARIRLCIGNYSLPSTVGIPKAHEQQKALVRCLRLAMEAGSYTILANHQPTIVAIAQELQRRNDCAGFEFQILHGVRPLEQRRLADIGYRSRVVLPYGPGWYDYLLVRGMGRWQSAYGYLKAVFDKR